MKITKKDDKYEISVYGETFLTEKVIECSKCSKCGSFRRDETDVVISKWDCYLKRRTLCRLYYVFMILIGLMSLVIGTYLFSSISKGVIVSAIFTMFCGKMIESFFDFLIYILIIQKAV